MPPWWSWKGQPFASSLAVYSLVSHRGTKGPAGCSRLGESIILATDGTGLVQTGGMLYELGDCNRLNYNYEVGYSASS